MNPLTKLTADFYSFITHTFNTQLPEETQFILNIDPTRQQFGDISSNVALLLAKPLGKSPREIAQTIKDGFKNNAVSRIEVAGPGFINFYIMQETFNTLVTQICTHGSEFFKSKETEKKKYNIEFVSANPTGPLHFGHGRGGIIGDVLANVLSFLSHDVTREYYINDAGVQIQKLGNSLKICYQQISGMDARIPEDGYHGGYLKDLAQKLYDEHGNNLLDQPISFFSDYAKVKLLKAIKHTLKQYGITFDAWFSEQSLYDNNEIQKVLELLEDKGYLYEHDNALWFRSTLFGDDKDRVVKKKDDVLTYAAGDIAYLKNKADRGFDHFIYILGHDHHSYAVRLESFRKALDIDKPLDVILYQLVKLTSSGDALKMSKRAGTMVTLQDVIGAVGPDVARFFYLNKNADTQLEFDVDLALKKTEDNPVYYIQYAYVRTGSILAKAAEHPEFADVKCSDTKHLTDASGLLIKKIVYLSTILVSIQDTLQTYLLAQYTYELAQLFSQFYAHHKVIDPQNPDLTRSRLVLVQIVRSTLSLCLDLMELSKPDKM